MPCPSLLYTHPPEGGEGPVHPLKSLAEGFEVSFAEFGVPWVFPRICQRHEDDAASEGPEGTPVDASESAKEISAACPGEAPYPISDASTATPMRTELVTDPSVLEGECGYRPSYGRGKVSNPLM